jgi:tetratricopeptide (TPR) repeat protein
VRSLVSQLCSALTVLGLVVLGAACSSTPRPWSFETSTVDRYQQLTSEEIDELRQAVGWLEEGDLMAARSTLASLANRAPQDVPVAFWQQEARVAYRSELEASRGDSVEVASSPEEVMRDRYRLEAQQSPSPLAYLLAARLEDDGLAARLLLDQAINLDPEFSWAYYARAHVAASSGDWSTARAELERTFKLQPGHLPALRLYGWLQAAAGDVEAAIQALEAWLEHADEDLLATEQTADEVRLDLALAHDANGDEGRALQLLAQLAPGRVDEIRRLTALAVVEEGGGDVAASLRAVQQARESDGQALLPAVQEALLLELWLGDEEASMRVWREVIEIASNSEDLAAGLQLFRAEVHLQRLESRAGHRRGEGP